MDRRLIDYLPDVLKGVKEMGAINSTEQPEIDELWKYFDEAFEGQYIHTATGATLKRWERIVGIMPRTTESLDGRRAAVLLRWNRKPPYTLGYLKQILYAAVGEDYSIRLNQDKYKLEIVIFEEPASVLRSVLESIKTVIPANIILNLNGSYKFIVNEQEEVQVLGVIVLFDVLNFEFVKASNITATVKNHTEEKVDAILEKKYHYGTWNGKAGTFNGTRKSDARKESEVL